MALAYVPPKIIVGYQKQVRDSEAKENKTKFPLAYVVYKDEKGKLRKEKSWNDWRDQNRAPAEFDNVPIEGFKFLRTVQRSRDWFGTGRNMWRVLHPKGFQFEITSDNLEAIFHEIGITKGGIITTKCLLGWQGVALLLIPEGTELYDEFLESSKRITADKVKKNTIKCGNTVTLKDGRKAIFYGKFCHLTTVHTALDSQGKTITDRYYRHDVNDKYTYKWIQKEVIEPIDENKANVRQELEVKGSFDVVSIDDTNEIPREKAVGILNDWLTKLRKEYYWNADQYIIFSDKPKDFKIIKTFLTPAEVSTHMGTKSGYNPRGVYYDGHGCILGLEWNQYGHGNSGPQFRYTNKFILRDNDTAYEIVHDHSLGSARGISTVKDVMALNPIKLELIIPELDTKQVLDI